MSVWLLIIVSFLFFRQDLPELGEILLSLSYLPSAKRLNLNILRGRQLLQTDLVGGAGNELGRLTLSTLFFSNDCNFFFSVRVSTLCSRLASRCWQARQNEENVISEEHY